MSGRGFISLHRKLKSNPVWQDPNYLKLWVYCLFEASHKDRDQLVGNEIVPLKRGQFVTGRNSLSDEMNLGVKPKQRLNDRTWFRYLKNLETWGMLTIKSTNKYSVVTIDNYDTYQDNFNKKVQGSDQQLSNKSPATDQQLSTNNNYNNLNNLNNNTTTNIGDEDFKSDKENKIETSFAILSRYMELKGALNFSPKDEMAANEIAQENIPLDKAIKYLEDCFSDFEQRKKHNRDKINGLDYCVGYIFDRHHEDEEGNDNVTGIHKFRGSNARNTGKGTSYEQAKRELEAAERALGRGM